MRFALHWQILIGMIAGTLLGLALNAWGTTVDALITSAPWLSAIASGIVGVNAFIGDAFLRGLRFIAVPIVLFSLVVGASSLSDLRRMSRIGGRTIGLYLCTTAVAISTGLVLASVLRPGSRIPEAMREQLAAAGAAEAGGKLAGAEAPDVLATFLNIIPLNPFESLAEGQMLQIVFAALVVGLALGNLPKERAEPVIRAAEGLNDAFILVVEVLMRFAPIAVFALMAKVMAELGLDVLSALVAYAFAVLLGLAIMMFVVYPGILRAFTGYPLVPFFRAIAPAQLLGFSSSSSAATLPVTMDCVENGLGVSEEVTSFVVPLGATLNMDGTALYQGVAALFIVQMYGIDITFADQLTIVLTATLASIGTAGVPGVGIIMLVIVLQSIAIPPEVMQGGIAILLGIDRLLDMARTACNITGDCMVASVVGHFEGDLTPPRVPPSVR